MGKDIATLTFDTFFDLRGSAAAQSASVTVLGRDVVNDGFGGSFYWDENSTEPDDNINIIQKIGNLTGRWKRLSDLYSGLRPTLQNVTELGNTTDKTASFSGQLSDLVDQLPKGINLGDNTISAGGQGAQDIKYNTREGGTHKFNFYGSRNSSNPIATFEGGPVQGEDAQSDSDFVTKRQNDLKINILEKGVSNGVTPLDSSGKVPPQYLPSYVSSVQEYPTFNDFPTPGLDDVIYVSKDTNKTFRWSGTTYIEISSSDVNSVFGRAGNVTAQTGDYDVSQVTNAASTQYVIGELSRSKDVYVGKVSEIRSLDLTGLSYKYFVTLDYGNGGWYLDPLDTTTADNLGTVIVTSDGSRIKRMGKPNILNFGALPDFNYTTQTGTDNTSAIQSNIDYIASIGGGDVMIPEGNFFITGTMYINKLVATPINIVGVNRLSKDRANDFRGSVLQKRNAGDFFKVNLKSDGTPLVTGGTTYQLNVSFIGFSMEGSETEEVYGIRAYRTRGTYENLGGKVLEALIMQDELRPSSYPTGTWDNYCDQSNYKNITMFRMKKYGLYCSASDASTFEGIRYEYPNVSAIYGIRIHHAYGFTVKDILHSNGNNEMTQKSNSYFMWIKESGNFTISGVQNENNNFEANIYLDRCKGFNILGVGERFKSKDTIRTQGCREFVIMGVAVEATKLAGYYDINDNPTFPSVGMSWSHFRLEASPGQPVVVRPIQTNFTPDSNRGHYENYEKVTSDITSATINKVDYDSYVLATPNYANTPNFALIAPATLVLPEISQNSTFSIPGSSNFGGRRMVIKNINTSAFSWTLSGTIRTYDNGTSGTTNVFPNGTVTEIMASNDSTVLPIAWYMKERNDIAATGSNLGLIRLSGPEFSGTGSAPAIGTINASKIAHTYTQVAPLDSDYTANAVNQFYQVQGITANRVFTLPSSPASGSLITILNRNGSTSSWNTNVSFLNNGDLQTLIPNGTVVTLVFGVGSWRVLDIYSPLTSAPFNPIAGTGITLTGTYPNVTFNSSTSPVILSHWGDSLTFGTGSTTGNTFPELLSKETGIPMYNGGVPGETSTQIKNRLIAAPAVNKQAVVIWAGRNNYSDPTTVLADIASMVSNLNGRPFVVLSILNGEYVSERKGGADYNVLVGLNNSLKSIYKERFIDVRRFLVELYNPSIPLDASDYLFDIVPSSLRSDQIHLNDLGYRKVADFIKRNVNKILGDGVLNLSGLQSEGMVQIRDNVVSNPLLGEGLELFYSSGNGYLGSFDRDNGVPKPLNIQNYTGATTNINSLGGILNISSPDVIIPSRTYVSGGFKSVVRNQGTGYLEIIDDLPVPNLQKVLTSGNSFSSAVNSDFALTVENTGTTNANGMYLNIGASSTGTILRVDKAGSAVFEVKNNGDVDIKGQLKVTDLSGVGTRNLRVSSGGTIQAYTETGTGIPSVSSPTSGITVTLVKGNDSVGLIDVSNTTGSTISNIMVEITYGIPYTVVSMGNVVVDSTNILYHNTDPTFGSTDKFSFEIPNGQTAGSTIRYGYIIKGY